MNQVVLLIGGNMGDRNMVLAQSIQEIENKCGVIKKKSRLFESEAWGFDTQNNFLNQAIEIETKLSSHDLLLKLQQIEKQLGRTEKTNSMQEYSSRLIDIDIMFFNSEIITEDKLIVPHPRLHLRKFTLDCLQDISPDYIHPILKTKIKDLNEHCSDKTKVWQYA